MGFSFKKIVNAALNPANILNPMLLTVPTVVSGGLDYYAAEKDRDAQKAANDANIALQREFAQHGLRWRMDDAKAAGIHPLAALGFQGPSPSISVMPETSGDKYRALSSMGQNITRALASTSTKAEREFAALQLQNQQKQNQLLDIEILERTKRLNAGPSFPGGDLGITIPGQGDSSVTSKQPIVEMPVQRTSSVPGAPYADFGHIADFSFVRTPYGLAIAPSKDVKERIEDQLIPELMWSVRNNLMPNISRMNEVFGGRRTFPKPTTDKYPLPETWRRNGYKSWEWSFGMQQFVPSKKPE